MDLAKGSEWSLFKAFGCRAERPVDREEPAERPLRQPHEELELLRGKQQKEPRAAREIMKISYI